MVFNNGLRVIEYNAFYYCISLECIVVPPTVREITEDAFSECEKLSLVILQNGLEIIRSRAFSGTSIKTIKIPLSVTEIWDDAFEHCSNLTHVVFCDMIKNFVSTTFLFKSIVFFVCDNSPFKLKSIIQ